MEPWMQEKKTKKPKSQYARVGSTFIVARVCSFRPRTGLYEIRWLDTWLNNVEELVDLGAVRRGRAFYSELHKNGGNPRWMELCRPDPSNRVDAGVDISALEEGTLYDYERQLPVSIAEVEKIDSMRFDPSKSMDAPDDLYTHADGSTDSYVYPEYRHLFEHSACSSFFAYLPLYYWKQVLEETNDHAHSLRIPEISMTEFMKFLGILFYMAVVDKGEMANYWGDQVESGIFEGSSTSLEGVMKIKRFKSIRRSFCFRNPRSLTAEQRREDSAVRIRPLLNLLKTTGSKYIHVGRDIAVDEASIACKSRYGRHLIMYNPTKPGGKYHFRFYMACCATSWIALNFRLHCTSTIENRFDGIQDAAAARAIEDDFKDTAKVRQHVLEVVHPFNGTKRIINCDNYYTSVQLLEALRVKGLYCRGTVRRTSKHYPKHVILDDPKKKSTVNVERGSSRQGVSVDHQMIAASWCDGSIVTMVSNADSSNITTVTRLIKATRETFEAPEAIKMYNQNMQGVDRHDQLRARFSLADGHSFKRWHKKLGLAMIDIARVNAFQTRQLAGFTNGVQRDAHRVFMTNLIKDLIHGNWQYAPSSEYMLFDDPGDDVPVVADRSPRTENGGRHSPAVSSPLQHSACVAVSSVQIFGKSSKKRVCVVCRFEGRKPTQQTDFCSRHSVCLCKKVFAMDRGFGCDRDDLTCWQKYHQVYQPAGLFSARGNLKKSCQLYKDKVSATALVSPTQPPIRGDQGTAIASTTVRSLSFDSLTQSDVEVERIASLEY